MHVMSIGLAVALVMLFPPHSEQAQSALAGLLPLQSSAAACGYAASAGFINMVHAARCMQDMAAGHTERFWNTLPCLDDELIRKRMLIPPPLSLLDMREILKDHGIRTSARKLERSALSELMKESAEKGLPFIMHLALPAGRPDSGAGHFVLVLGRGLEPGTLALFDPAGGLAVAHPARLEASASGYVLLAEDRPASWNGMDVLVRRLLEIARAGGSIAGTGTAGGKAEGKKIGESVDAVRSGR